MVDRVVLTPNTTSRTLVTSPSSYRHERRVAPEEEHKGEDLGAAPAAAAADEVVTFLRCEVHDDGEGVSAALAKRLFNEMFVRGQARDEGTGVGLCTVRAQCTKLGGRCDLGKSDRLQGAVFWFEVPLRRDDTGLADGDIDDSKLADLVDRATQTAAARSPILVVDDDEVIRQTLTNTLESHGFVVETAKNGAAGLDMMKETEYGLVLSDVQMPRLDGYQMLKKIREWEHGGEGGGRAPRRDGRRQPMVFLSANFTSSSTTGNCEEIDQAVQAGGDGWISKPVALGALLSAVVDKGRELPLTSRASSSGVCGAEDNKEEKDTHSILPQDGRPPSSVRLPPLRGKSPSGDRRAPGGGEAPVLDVAAVRKALQGNYPGKSYVGMMKAFPLMLDEMSISVEKLAQRPTAGVAHKLKGSFATLFLEQLRTVALRIELACKDNDKKEAEGGAPGASEGGGRTAELEADVKLLQHLYAQVLAEFGNPQM